MLYSLDNEISEKGFGRSSRHSITGTIREVCKRNNAEILRGHVSRDHVHLFVSVPSHLAVSKLVQYPKGKSTYKLMQENKQLSKLFWGRHVWSRGYFVATSGNITDELY